MLFRLATQSSMQNANNCRRNTSAACKNTPGGATSPDSISWVSAKKYRSWGLLPSASVVARALPSRRPARPTRCKKLAWLGGTEHSNTEDKSPMSTPISSVGVAERRFSNQGLGCFDLKRLSRASRTGRSSNPVCSAAITRRKSPLLKRRAHQSSGCAMRTSYRNSGASIQAMPSRCAASCRGTASLRLLPAVATKATSVSSSSASGLMAQVSPWWWAVSCRMPASLKASKASRYISAARPLTSMVWSTNTAAAHRSYQVARLLPVNLSKPGCVPRVRSTGRGVCSPILGIHSALLPVFTRA